jgi:phosphoglycerate dehydrogenase-like enzyme
VAPHPPVPSLLITEDYAPEVRAVIREAVPEGWSVAYLPEADRAGLEQATVLCSGSTGGPRALLDQLPALRLVQHLGIGVDKIDRAACDERGISILRLAGSNAVSVAEHTVLLILASLRRLPAQDRSVRQGAWEKERIRSFARLLYRKRVGIVGFGMIGREVAKRLRGFDVDLVYFDTIAASPDVEQRLEVRRCELDELFATSDVVTLHCPLTEATRNLVGAGRLATMKRGATLVNCARGGVVDQSALEAALRSGHLLAAGLDTLASEPPGQLTLFELPNLVVTPHAAASTLDNFAYVMSRAAENIAAFHGGGALPPADLVVDQRRAPALAGSIQNIERE